MDRYQSRGKLLTNFQGHWSIQISPENKAPRDGGPYSAEKKTNKHKQLLGIVPGMGGGQIRLCVAFFLDKKGNT